jgi:hypothetical protein
MIQREQNDQRWLPLVLKPTVPAALCTIMILAGMGLEVSDQPSSIVFAGALTPHRLLGRSLLFTKEKRLVDSSRQCYFGPSLCLHISTGASRYGTSFYGHKPVVGGPTWDLALVPQFRLPLHVRRVSSLGHFDEEQEWNMSWGFPCVEGSSEAVLERIAAKCSLY